jgi:hypothetical protein
MSFRLSTAFSRSALLAGLTSALAATPAAVAQCTEGCVAIHEWEGESAGDQFGWVSNNVGDLDGDGIDDLVLTAPTLAVGNNGNVGRIYVYSGATGDELWRATGGGTGWWFGHDATTAGDVDGDEIPDVIAGAPNSGAGRVRLYSGGKNGALLDSIGGEANGDQFGYRVNGGGDFNGDGTGDVVIGAPGHDAGGSSAGRAYVYSGVDYALICSIDGASAGDRFGSGVTFVGDVTGDGRDDIAVGAQNAGESGGGLAYVYSFDGKTDQFEYTLAPDTPPFANFGLWFMNGGPDVDNDGTPDIYVNDYAVSRAYIFSGVDGAKIWTLVGDDDPTAQFGIGRIIDDIDGDCHADILMAAWISDEGASNAGKAFVYSGRTGEVFETFTHDVAGAGFGFDANGMGDVDGDGAYDHLITAASDLSSRGKAYLIAGNVAPPLAGDLDDNDVIDFDDLLAVLSAWGPCEPPPARCRADLDCDGTVGFDDLLIVLSNWS